jgi:hypothetical protein
MSLTAFTCQHKGGVLFKGNLRGKPSKSYEKITNRLQVMTCSAKLFITPSEVK